MYVLLFIIFFYLIFYKFSNIIKESFTNEKNLKDKLCEIIRDKNKEEHFYTTYIKMEKLFNFFDIQFIAIGGTLIGAYRDGKFLPWDYDMDFCVNFNYNDKIKSKEFKKKATKLGLEFKYYELPNSMWGGIGGLKVCNKGKWDKGQIDVFFFSNAHDENVFYLGNDGKPHGWANENLKKENLFPLQLIKLKFPTINKTIEVPCPRNPEPELMRHFGNDFKDTVPEKYSLWFKVDKLLF